jgi:hypothetical protein
MSQTSIINSPALAGWLKSSLAVHQQNQANNTVPMQSVLLPLDNGVEAIVAGTRVMDLTSKFSSVRLSISLQYSNKPSQNPSDDNVMVVEMPLNEVSDRDSFLHELNYFKSLQGKLATTVDFKKTMALYKNHLTKENITYSLGEGEMMKRLNNLQPSQAAKPQYKSNTQSSNNSGKPYIAKKKWLDTKNVLPLHLMRFLQERGLIIITGQQMNTGPEDYVRFKMKNAPDGQNEFNFTMRSDEPNRINQRPEKRFYWVDNRTRQGGKNCTGLIVSMATNGLFGNVPTINETKADGYFKEVMGKFSELNKNIPEESMLQEFDIENELKLTIGSPDRMARLPIKSNKQHEKNEIYKIFSDKRKVSRKIVDHLISTGDLVVGTYADKKTNKYFPAQVMYRMHSFDAGSNLIQAQSDKYRKVANYQRFYLGYDKKKGPDSLVKRFLRASKGQYAGTLATKSQTLWLTEAILNHLSFKEMQPELRKLGMVSAEPNAISVLSTSGVPGFLEAVFDSSVRMNKSGEAEIYVVNRGENKEIDLKEDDLRSLKDFFSSNKIHYVNEGNSESSRQLSVLTALMTTVGVEPSINVMSFVEQFKEAKSLQVNNGSESPDIIFDASTVSEFLKETRIMLMPDGPAYTLKTTSDIKQQVEWETLSPDQQSQWKARIKERLSTALGTNSLGAAFDADKAGYEMSKALGSWATAMDVPFHEFIPKPTIVDIPGVGQRTVNDHNDIAMFYKDMVAGGDHVGAQTMMADYSSSLKMDVEYLLKAPENNIKRGR